MKTLKWSAIAFAVAAASTQMAVASQQSESNGFLEDSTLNLETRTLYFNRDFRNDPAPAGDRHSYTEELGLGLRAFYESGFTQGTVGFGVDAFAMTGIKLDSGGGRHSELRMFPTDGRSGKAQDNYTLARGAVKARLSNTVLKYGDQIVDLPVLSMDDARLLPESTTGFLVTSEEVDGLVLHAGHFTALRSMNSTRRDSKNAGELRSLDLIGGRYNFTDNLSAAYYYSKAKVGGKSYSLSPDFFINKRQKINKQYMNINYVHPIADEQSVTVDFNAYSTRAHDRHVQQDFRDRQGLAKNNIRSLAVAYNFGAHTVTVGTQKSEGNSAYNYGYDGGGSVYLLNDVQYNDFTAKGEKSYQARYDLDMSAYGVPGLSFMTRYVRGSNIANFDPNQLRERNTGKNWERDIEAKYVVQSGFAKDLSLRARHAVYRANDAARRGTRNDDVNELRLIVEYPLSIL